ncbi:MAG TPA: GNAT family N-acetyltransferase [Streptosporangiaceae bacterium]|jgi:GNAT superfamily N-acetyltransferase
MTGALADSAALPPIRRLSAAELADCIALTDDRGWAAEPAKWQLLFAAGEVYGAPDPAGGLAGMVALTRYGSQLAAIGMLVVASRHGRQGLGGRLMQEVMTRAGGAVLVLTATDMGRPLYERLGFTAVDTSIQHAGVFAAKPGDGSRLVTSPLRQAGLGPVLTADAEAFGADRRRVLTGLAGLADSFAGCGEPLTGYAAAWQNGGTRVIGPVVAPDAATASALISQAAAGRQGQIRLDVPGRQAELSRWLASRGLPAARQTTLMVRGGSLPGARERLWAQANVAIG